MDEFAVLLVFVCVSQNCPQKTGNSRKHQIKQLTTQDPEDINLFWKCYNIYFCSWWRKLLRSETSHFFLIIPIIQKPDVSGGKVFFSVWKGYCYNIAATWNSKNSTILSTNMNSFCCMPNSWEYLLPFIQLFADVTPLVEVGEPFRNGQEPKQQKQEWIHESKSCCLTTSKTNTYNVW